MTLPEAIVYATQAHHGQRRKGIHREPYVVHPIRVMLAIRDQGYSEEVQIAAVLHDVVEDTAWTLDFLNKKGLPQRSSQLVWLLTRQEDTPYATFIDQLLVDSDAVAIKVADIEDNLVDIDDTPALSGLKDRYHKALAVLHG